jgi:DNA-binding Xre family transcriptional regulator
MIKKIFNMVENVEIIRTEMERLNKGIRTLAEEIGTSTATIVKARDGKNVTTDTLAAVAEALGLKVIIVKDENADIKAYQRKKPVKRRRAKKIPVPKVN